MLLGAKSIHTSLRVKRSRNPNHFNDAVLVKPRRKTMALYAFDGTWNSDKPGTEKDTNVVWFNRAYQGTKRYWTGVGTRFSLVGKLVGGITGAGGHTRIREALVELTKNFMAGDTVVDIVGFSRGAALAVDFANEVAKQTGLPGPTPAVVSFLGIWDIVGSFDIPGDKVD